MCLDLQAADAWSVGCILWELLQCRRGISSPPFGKAETLLSLEDIKEIISGDATQW